MLRNYLLIAWRRLKKEQLFSSINIIGLAMGMAVAMMIGVWVWDELNFDHCHRNHERLGEILSRDTLNETVSVGPYASVPMAAALKTRCPDDLAALSLLSALGESFRNSDKMIGGWGAWVQEDLPAMISLSMLSGDIRALKDPGSMLLNASLAKSLFGSVDVVGRPLLMGDSMVWRVGGVYADLPVNSSFSGYHFFLPWENVRNAGRAYSDGWINHHFSLFVQLKEGRRFEDVSAKIRDLSKPHIKGAWEELALHPMDRWHLYDRAENGRMVAGRLQSLRLFGVIGALVLLMACINFMNLSTARSQKRGLETGIRKVLGSGRGQLMGQFFGESILTASIALVLAIGLIAVSLSWFGELAGRPVGIPWSSGWWWVAVLGFAGLTGILAGCYPAFYLSSFQPVRVMKGDAGVAGQGSLTRRILVVIQFSISMGLTIGTIAIYRQLQFAQDRPVGYSREGLITIPCERASLLEHADALRQELLQTGAIVDAAISSSPTTDVYNSMLGYDWEGRDPRTVPVIGTLFVGYHFGGTIGWEIKEGRDFIPGNAADSGAFILNEAAVRFTGLRNPVGKVIRWHEADYPIVGVVKDLVMESPYRAVEPVFFTISPGKHMHHFLMRINPRLPVKEGLSRIERVYHRRDPADVFYYQFADEAYGAKFLAEQQIGRLTSVFGVLAVIISCLGLFGLAAYVAEQRTKEIGIRKVLGAGVVRLWGLQTKEFMGLAGIAFCISAPLAWVILHRWLQGYEYRTGLSIWVFAAAGIGGAAVALATVSWQAIRAATKNPAESLRSE